MDGRLGPTWSTGPLHGNLESGPGCQGVWVGAPVLPVRTLERLEGGYAQSDRPPTCMPGGALRAALCPWSCYCQDQSQCSPRTVCCVHRVCTRTHARSEVQPGFKYTRHTQSAALLGLRAPRSSADLWGQDNRPPRRGHTAMELTRLSEDDSLRAAPADVAKPNPSRPARSVVTLVPGYQLLAAWGGSAPPWLLTGDSDNADRHHGADSVVADARERGLQLKLKWKTLSETRSQSHHFLLEAEFSSRATTSCWKQSSPPEPLTAVPWTDAWCWNGPQVHWGWFAAPADFVLELATSLSCLRSLSQGELDQLSSEETSVGLWVQRACPHPALRLIRGADPGHICHCNEDDDTGRFQLHTEGAHGPDTGADLTCWPRGLSCGISSEAPFVQ
ncbi:hypothetical protein CB1_000831012 [Camelus ferus]|nr:hypothetical protein CB1_000831012 [Camelus ferus]